MIRRRITIKIRYNAHQKKLIRDSIEATMGKNGVVVSNAKTAKEICGTVNYNRSIELPVCGMGKL